MGEVVNLNQRRKEKARLAAARQAEANRARHGRSKAERQNDRREEERRQALLDGARVLPAPSAALRGEGADHEAAEDTT